jgi:hypothetical protein
MRRSLVISLVAAVAAALCAGLTTASATPTCWSRRMRNLRNRSADRPMPPITASANIAVT